MVTGGVELCVAELGDAGKPTVVLVHGYPDSKEVWSDVAVRLAEHWHVVLYDVRGHGRSTAPKPLRGGFTLEKLTDDFLAVIDTVSPDRPVHVVGHDWGPSRPGSSSRSAGPRAGSPPSPRCPGRPWTTSGTGSSAG